MATASNSRVLRTLLLLIAVCLVSIPAQAQYGGGSNTMASAETSTYVFLSDESTVVKTGGFAGIHETYPIQGQFQLTVDANAGVASFDYVDAFLLSPISSSPPQSLGELFNMAELQGAVLDDTTISFTGKAADGSDVLITLTIEDDLAYLVGETIPPPNTADFFLFSLDAVAQRKYGGGSGEPNDPYLIYTAEQMNAVGAEPNDWDRHFILMADIDLSEYTGTEYNVIGTDMDNRFTGVFDGNGRTISNFSYTSTHTSYIGIFGCVGSQLAKGEIRDLGLLEPNVDAGTGSCVGSLVGYLGDGTISGCYSDGGITSGDTKVGGLAGDNGGTITNCYATGTVSCSGDTWYGGAGGLVGMNSAFIINCYSRADVSGYYTIGGLLGLNSGHIITCYSTGSVSGDENIGGLVGLRWGGTATDSFWDTQIRGVATGDDGTSKTTAEMQSMSTYTDAGWDFVAESVNGTEDIWSICEGTNYPRLAWQIPAGDFVCPDGITIEDFVFFAEYWRDDNCDVSNDYCDGTDLDFSGTVDEADLEILIENWLAGGND